LVTREQVGIVEAVDLLRSLGDWRGGAREGDGWLDGRPLVLGHERGCWEAFDFGGLRRLESALGWAPCGRELFVAAMSNGRVDHALLARVVVGLCDALSAAVDYGPLSVEPPDLPGWALELSHEVVPGRRARSAVVSARWLEAWARRPGFRLPK
jgi:hypothetical protein